MRAPHRYPVGVQVFEHIRTRGYLYADKTRYLWDMLTTGGAYYFLSRPRRFGKTLLVSTMEAYFQGRRELFEGLYISEREKEWAPHPVIRLDLSQFKGTEESMLASKFNQLFVPYEERYGIAPDRDEQPGVRLNALIRAAFESNGGATGVVVLVDEYDAPLLNVIHDVEKLQRFREVMREFYAPLKSCEPYLRFVFLTGISKFSQLSIFSELNTLNNISMVPHYAGICGFTEGEMDGQFAEDVAYLADRRGVLPQACREDLRRMYDGYRFSKSEEGVYNPYSLVTAINSGQLESYWFGSGTPTSLINVLRTYNVDITALDAVEATAATFDAPSEAMDDPIAFMYQSSYLTIKDYDPTFNVYTLGVPNEEVAEGLSRSLLPLCSGSSRVAADGLIARFGSAVLREGDMDKALGLLRTFLAGIPYDMAPKREKDFQTILYLMFRILGASISTEVRAARGRIDAVIDVPRAVYVMELKYRRAGESAPTAADAIAQIDAKGYLIPYEQGVKPVVKAGAVYSEDERTLAKDWIIA